MSFFKRHSVIMGFLLAVVVLVTAIAYHVIKRSRTTADSTPQIMSVNVVSAKEYLKNKGSVQANGTVESLEQAELRSQVSAPVTAIRVAIGDNVRKGQELVVLQNSDMAAQLAQAQAGVKAQQARLDEMRKGLRTEEYNLIQAKLDAAKQGLEDTKKQQDIAVKNAYSALLSTGLAATPSLGNVGSATVTLSGSYVGGQEGVYKISLYQTGAGLRFQTSGIETFDGEVKSLQTAFGTKGLYIQFSGTPNSSDTWTVNIPNTYSNSYSTLKNAYDAAVQGRQTAINAAQSQLDAAQRDFELKQAGASNEQIRSQEAAVDQARASVALIAAQLAKTVIRAPIGGTVSAIPVKFGELVNMGQSVVSIVNKGGMQVKAFLSEADLPLVEEGAEVVINDTIAGTVVRLSPSINSATKTVEVNVLVVDPDKSGLVVGQNASIKIKTKDGGEGVAMYVLPLQAVKISGTSAAVFTVDNGTLVEHQVKLGNVNGEQVEVVSGINEDMQLVPTVYELKGGQKVQVQ